MMKIVKYYKNANKAGNEGSIAYIENNRYLAVTKVDSKTYKTLKGAEKFMSKYGYIKA